MTRRENIETEQPQRDGATVRDRRADPQAGRSDDPREAKLANEGPDNETATDPPAPGSEGRCAHTHTHIFFEARAI